MTTAAAGEIGSNKVLIIDEDSDYRTFFTLMSEHEGYTPFEAESGKRGFKTAKEIMPDCIIISQLLPHETASSLIAKFKSDAMLKNVPIILLTQNDSKEAFIEGIESGADDHINRTNDYDIILTRIKAMLRIKRLQDENSLFNNMLKHDLMSAGKIQSAIFKKKKRIPDLNLSYLYRPYGEVSGDYFDVKQFSKDVYGIIMADVAGHGVAASMLTLFIRAYFESSASDGKGGYAMPNEFLANLNNSFVEEGFESSFFTTVFYAVYNKAEGIFSFSKGGHPAPVLFRSAAGETEFLQSKGMLVGVVDGMEYELKEIHLSAHDSVFLYTDGIFEVFSEDEDIFGEERLKDLFEREIKNESGGGMKRVLKNIYKNVEEFSKEGVLEDDVTMLLLQKKA